MRVRGYYDNYSVWFEWHRHLHDLRIDHRWCC